MEQTWIWDCRMALALVIVLATIMYTAVKKLLKGHWGPQAHSALSGIDILQVIRASKLLPLMHGPTWRLHDFCHDMRVWRGQVAADHSPGHPITLYGCFSKVKGSSQVVLKTIIDLQKYPEWQPQLSMVTQLARAQEAPPLSTRTKASPGVPVQHDYVSVETDVTSSRLARALNHLSLRIWGEPFVRKIININRYWHREDNGCCWVLEAPEKMAGCGWTFYLAQPVEEMDQCLLTIIQAASSVHSNNEAALAAFRLGALQNYFLYRKVQCTPLTGVTMPSATEQDGHTQEEYPVPTYPVRTPTGPKSISKSKSADDLKVLGQQQSAPKSPASEPSSTPKTENNILKRFRNLIEEKKEWYEERKRKSQDTRRSCSPEGGEMIEATSVAQNPMQEEGSNSDSDLSEYMEEEHPIGIPSNIVPAKNVPPKMPDQRKTLLQFLRGSSVGASSHGNEDQGGTGEETTAVQKVAASRSGLSLNLLHRIKTSGDVGTLEGDNGNEAENAVVETEETEDEQMANAYRTMANTVAAELISEKFKVSNIDISLSYDEQAMQTGGWIYCGLEKEVVILRKMIDDRSPVQSYLGKGIIPVPPKTVFEALKNPRTRFTYDEMLKNVDILHDFGKGLKIVYLYHEVSQLFRKESRDFCILQSERIEGFKYIISMKSVNWPDCPTKNDITRGKFHSSGWIIEPANRDNKLYSMITYIVQMELGTSKTNSGYLVEELAAKQPISIANLRYYLAPSLAQRPNQNVSSSGAEHKKALPPVGTFAAAAAFATQGMQRRGSLEKSFSLDT